MPGPEPEDGVQYEIEAVLDERRCGGQGTKRKEYLVTYKNWGDEWDAWLSEAQIENLGGGAMLELQSFKNRRDADERLHRLARCGAEMQLLQKAGVHVLPNGL